MFFQVSAMLVAMSTFFHILLDSFPEELFLPLSCTHQSSISYGNKNKIALMH